jgi:hypothetical protein
MLGKLRMNRPPQVINALPLDNPDSEAPARMALGKIPAQVRVPLETKAETLGDELHRNADACGCLPGQKMTAEKKLPHQRGLH